MQLNFKKKTFVLDCFACMHVYHVCAECMEVRRGGRIPWTEITDDREATM